MNTGESRRQQLREPLVCRSFTYVPDQMQTQKRSPALSNQSEEQFNHVTKTYSL
jgi:hypothetical protein